MKIDAMIRISFGLLVFLICMLPGKTNAQVVVKDMDLDENLDSWYSGLIGSERGYASRGIYYKMKSQTIQHHQFYKESIWYPGQLSIHGESLDSIRMLYNTYQDILIAENIGAHRANFQSLRLHQKQVNQFKIHGDLFVYLKNESLSKEGFYHLIYSGDYVGLVAKRVKIQDVNERTVQYKVSDLLYVRIKDTYHRYRGKLTLYAIFPNHKREIKSFIKSAIGTMKKGDEMALTQVLNFCETEKYLN